MVESLTRILVVPEFAKDEHFEAMHIKVGGNMEVSSRNWPIIRE
jgi:hypothetical protein